MLEIKNLQSIDEVILNEQLFCYIETLSRMQVNQIFDHVLDCLMDLLQTTKQLADLLRIYKAKGERAAFHYLQERANILCPCSKHLPQSGILHYKYDKVYFITVESPNTVFEFRNMESAPDLLLHNVIRIGGRYYNHRGEEIEELAYRAFLGYYKRDYYFHGSLAIYGTNLYDDNGPRYPKIYNKVSRTVSSATEKDMVNLRKATRLNVQTNLMVETVMYYRVTFTDSRWGRDEKYVYYSGERPLGYYGNSFLLNCRGNRFIFRNKRHNALPTDLIVATNNNYTLYINPGDPNNLVRLDTRDNTAVEFNVQYPADQPKRFYFLDTNGDVYFLGKSSLSFVHFQDPSKNINFNLHMPYSRIIIAGKYIIYHGSENYSKVDVYSRNSLVLIDSFTVLVPLGNEIRDKPIILEVTNVKQAIPRPYDLFLLDGKNKPYDLNQHHKEKLNIFVGVLPIDVINRIGNFICL